MAMSMPNGGRGQGWIAVLTWWTVNFVWVGIIKGMGIMLPTLQDQLATQTWIMGWIAAMIYVVSGITAPFAGLLGRRFGAGRIITMGNVMVSMAAIAGAFTKTALQLALVYSLLSGIGLGVSDVLAREAVCRCFNSNYATATGIARTGVSIGLLVFGPLIQLFLNTYGWRGTMLLVGGISLHGVVCGALMVTAGHKPTDYQSLQREDPPSTPHTSILSDCSSFRNHAFNNFDLELLRNPSYWSVAGIYCCTSFAYTMWIVYFVSQARSNGFTLEEAGTFVTVAGVANLLAKVSQGPLTDYGVVSSWCLTAIITTITSVSYCASPWLCSYWTMMTSAFLVLFGDGVLNCQIDVLTKQALEVDLLVGAFGWMKMTSSILAFGLGFLPGWLYDNTGGYTSAFLLIGFVQAFSLIPLLILRFLKHDKDVRQTH